MWVRLRIPLPLGSQTFALKVAHFPRRDVRKVRPLLEYLEKAGKNVQYYALDLSKQAVAENLNSLLASKFLHINCFGLWGTFEDGLAWSETVRGPRMFLSLGSIFGNDRFERAVKYLSVWARALRPTDSILLGIDCCQDRDVVWKSYHDAEGIFETFIRNAFVHSNRVLGEWY